MASLPKNSATLIQRQPKSRGHSRSAFSHGLHAVAIDVLKRAKNPKEAKSVLKAIVAININTIVGPVGWAKGPVKTEVVPIFRTIG